MPALRRRVQDRLQDVLSDSLRGAAYSDNLFVTFNMAAYALFTTCAVLVFYLHADYLLMPAMFFSVYGAIGNAISHTVWSAVARAYRPGLITAQAYWIIGPYALYKLTGRPMGDRRHLPRLRCRPADHSQLPHNTTRTPDLSRIDIGPWG